MPDIIELETERLILRQWMHDDFLPYAQMCADPRVMEYFPATLSQNESKEMALRCQSLIAERGWGLWALEEKASGNFIGFTGLHIPKATLPFSPCVEIGWRLSADYWGKGLASEAARASLKVGFETLALDEIVSFTTLTNTRSQAVMKRLGMTLDPETFKHPDLDPDHELIEHCLYRLSKTDWSHNK
ncbi:GNAT family N-acetyltransferase [Endozoicomonas arenosclerae]|uniref:GNAT family N-acetyltransferase n=1 Tax=Endozoicomonas arenosclerae TaxID=1633495 RepID=UPI00078166ED|nr:GNAT family N-acetyltransferase [Endozoicomonas arenosclerae]